MDNVCHTLAGAVLGDAGLKRQTPLGMATLMVASNLPDIDVLVFATDTVPMSFRRGWTHGVLAMAVLPAAFAAIIYAVDRLSRRRSPPAPAAPAALASPRANLNGLLLLAYVGTWLHVFMDFLNSYGVRLLMPFSERWYYGDALYIVDPILYILFGGAIILGRRTHRSEDRGRVSRLGLTVAAIYMLAMLASNGWARNVVRDGLTRAGRSADTRFMVTPVIANPFKREVVIDLGGRYEKGFLWFEPLPHFRPAGYGVDVNAEDPLARQAAQTRVGQAYLRWSRFPFFVVQRTGADARVQLNDYRYSGPGGRETWLAVTVAVPGEKVQ
jgi:inner membrane protein